MSERLLRLADAAYDDDEHDLVDEILESVASGSTQPTIAAKAIDIIVTNSSNRRYAAQEIDPDSDEGCSPLGWTEYLWRQMGEIASKTSWADEGHDHLVQLVKELTLLPPTILNAFAPSQVSYQIEVWQRIDDMGEVLNWVAIEMFQDGKAVEERRYPDILSWYSNFHAYLAKLFASGVVALDGWAKFSSHGFLQLSPPYSHSPESCEPYVLASVQWMLHAGPELFEMCDQKAYGALMYNKGWWERWKGRFVEVADPEEGFSEETQAMAKRALEKMDYAETVGCGELSMIEHYGYDVKYEGEDEEEEDEEEDEEDEEDDEAEDEAQDNEDEENYNQEDQGSRWR